MGDRWRSGLSVVGVGTLVALTGCGGDEESAATEATATEATATEAQQDSAEEYTREVEGVLNPLGGELTAASGVLTRQSPLDERAGVLGQVHAAVADAIAELEAIEPPPELAEPHDGMIAALESYDQATVAAQEAAETGDVQALQTDYPRGAVQLERDLTEVDQQFQREGVDLSAALGT
jgi:hypothetical protein